MSWICSFCGGPASASQFPHYWCSGCSRLHDWATCEPSFEMLLAPTPTRQLIASVLYRAILAIANLIPAKHVIAGNRLAIWTYAQAYWQAYLADGGRS